MLLLDLYDALGPLDLITGATYADDILGISSARSAWESEKIRGIGEIGALVISDL